MDLKAVPTARVKDPTTLWDRIYKLVMADDQHLVSNAALDVFFEVEGYNYDEHGLLKVAAMMAKLNHDHMLTDR